MASLSRRTASTLFFTKLLRLNHSRAVVTPFAAARSFHATAPTRNSGYKISDDHLHMFKTFGFMKHPYQMEGPGRSCDLQEDDDALYARVDMPSVAKEGLKMWVENNSLYITGEEGEKDEDCLPEERTTLQLQNESERRKFSTSIAIAPRRFKTDEIKAVLKNGVLRVVIPKLKHGETSKFVHIMIN